MEYKSFLECYSDDHFDSFKLFLARKKEHVKKYSHINDTPHDLMFADNWGGGDPPFQEEKKKRKKHIIIARRTKKWGVGSHTTYRVYVVSCLHLVPSIW